MPKTSLGGGSLLGFKGVGINTLDKITVPEGYMAVVIAAWGEPVGLSGEMPAFKEDGSNTAAEQAAHGVSVIEVAQKGGQWAMVRPAAPRKLSNWPDQRPTGRPRSATVVIRKVDGGVIGT